MQLVALAPRRLPVVFTDDGCNFGASRRQARAASGMTLLLAVLARGLDMEREVQAGHCRSTAYLALSVVSTGGGFKLESAMRIPISRNSDFPQPSPVMLASQSPRRWRTQAQDLEDPDQLHLGDAEDLGDPGQHRCSLCHSDLGEENPSGHRKRGLQAPCHLLPDFLHFYPKGFPAGPLPH